MTYQQPTTVDHASGGQIRTVYLTDDQVLLMEQARDVFARACRHLVTGLTDDGIPLRAAENAVADMLTSLVEAGWHSDA